MNSQNISQCYSIHIGMNEGTKNSDMHGIAANLSEVLARVDEWLPCRHLYFVDCKWRNPHPSLLLQRTNSVDQLYVVQDH